MNRQAFDWAAPDTPALPAEGLRERKKRLMRQQLSDTATQMFLERGRTSDLAFRRPDPRDALAAGLPGRHDGPIRVRGNPDPGRAGRDEH